MRTICLYFEIHQIIHLKRYRFFDIGKDHYYYDDFVNESSINEVAERSYIPALNTLIEMVRNSDNTFKVALVDLLVLLLLGAALGATDPIGIKGVLSSVRAPHHLMVKLEGESLFNDAMCIALFMTLLNVLQGENFTVMGVLQTLLYEIFSPSLLVGPLV